MSGDGSVQDASIEQVEADMRLLEELLERNKFNRSFHGQHEDQEGEEGLETGRSYGRLMRILGEGSEDDEVVSGSGTRDLEEELDAGSSPVEVTDFFSGERGRLVSSFLSEEEEEEEENEAGELTMRDLPFRGEDSNPSHRIPSPSSAGADAAEPSQAAAQRRRKKSKKARPEDLVPRTLTRAPRNRHSMANVMEKVAAEEMAELTFRPKTAWGGGEAAAPAPMGRKAKGDRIDRLSRPMTDKWTQRELEKLREEMAEASKYPFAPSIGDRSAELAAKKARRGGNEEDIDDTEGAHQSGEPIEVRLMKSSRQREASRRQAKLEKEYAELMHCTFKPNVSARGRHLPDDYKPIHQRLHKVLQEKSLRLASARMSREMEDPNLTFAPKINSKSAKLARMKQIKEELSTIDRLASGMPTTARDEAAETRRRELESRRRKGKAAVAWSSSTKPAPAASPSASPGSGAAKSHEPKPKVTVMDVSKVVPREFIDCTFSPQINKKSKEILQNSEVWHPDFYKRQDQAVQHKRRLLSEGKRTEDPDCTFRPDIGNARHFLRQQENKNLKETKIETVTRLSSRDLEEKRIREESIRESYYSQFDFKPRLSDRSREIARGPTNLNELVYNERGEKIRRSIAREVEEEFNQMCTFQPDLGPTSSSRPGGRGGQENVVPLAALQIAGDKETVIQRIEQYRQEKELRIRESREEREQERLRECTFAPRTNHGAVGARLNKPVVVHGLTRFLRNREAARRKDEEKRRREKEVFATGHKTSSRSGAPRPCFTVAEPFRLSKSKTAKKKMDALRMELERDFEEKCTFQPKLRSF